MGHRDSYNRVQKLRYHTHTHETDIISTDHMALFILKTILYTPDIIEFSSFLLSSSPLPV